MGANIKKSGIIGALSNEVFALMGEDQIDEGAVLNRDDNVVNARAMISENRPSQMICTFHGLG